MKLHVLTACTRPDNLGLLARSITEATAGAPGLNVHWHVGFDPDGRHAGGQVVKNRLLDSIPASDTHDDWAVILDDDTLMHFALPARLYELACAKPDARAFVFTNCHKDGTVWLRAAADNVKMGSIDAGQVVFSTFIASGARIPDMYEGDGYFFEKILRGRGDVVFVDEPLAIYNALR